MKKVWAWPAQAATWLVGLVLLFVVSPPRLAVDDPPVTIDKFVQFALAIVIGIVFALSTDRPTRKGRRASAIASAALLLIAIAGFGCYLYLTDRWTCRYDGGAAMVIGGQMTPEAARYAAKTPGLDCTTLIQDFAGQTALIWPRDQLTDRRLGLIGLFSAVVILFAMSALFMIRAIGAKSVPLAEE